MSYASSHFVFLMSDGLIVGSLMIPNFACVYPNALLQTYSFANVLEEGLANFVLVKMLVLIRLDCRISLAGKILFYLL